MIRTQHKILSRNLLIIHYFIVVYMTNIQKPPGIISEGLRFFIHFPKGRQEILLLNDLHSLRFTIRQDDPYQIVTAT